MRQPSIPQKSSRRARGVTLVVVLLILVVVTILGIGGAQIALLGERSTRYDRDYLIASQAAEAALLDAERDIDGINRVPTTRSAQFTQDNLGIFAPGCSTNPATQGLCQQNDPALKPVWAQVDFSDQSSTAPSVAYGTFTGQTFAAGSTGIMPARVPRYVIEIVPDVEGTNARQPPMIYRITAIGYGPRADIQVVMQTSFRKEKG